MMEWVKVEDCLPEHGERVLVVFTHKYADKTVACVQIDSKSFKDSIWMDGVEHGGYEWEWDFEWSDVTHWGYLPKSNSIYRIDNKELDRYIESSPGTTRFTDLLIINCLKIGACFTPRIFPNFCLPLSEQTGDFGSS